MSTTTSVPVSTGCCLQWRAVGRRWHRPRRSCRTTAARCPARAHRALEVALHLPLRPTAEPRVHELLQDLRRRGRPRRGWRGAHRRPSPREPLTSWPAGTSSISSSSRSRRRPWLADGQAVILESHLPDSPLRRGARRRPGVGRARRAPRSNPLTLALGLLHVAEVRDANALELRTHDAESVGPGEASQVADVHQVRDEQGVQPLLAQHLHEPIGAVGHRASVSRNSSSSRVPSSSTPRPCTWPTHRSAVAERRAIPPGRRPFGDVTLTAGSPATSGESRIASSSASTTRVEDERSAGRRPPGGAPHSTRPRGWSG